MSEAKALHEQDQERYVRIATHIRRVGEEFREDLFAAVEADDLEGAFEIIETLKNLDTIFMLATKTGMAIEGAKKKEWEKSPEGQASLKAEQDRQQAEIDAAFAARDKLKKAQAELGISDPQTKSEAQPAN